MREKICGVYRIENTVTGECYVGSSTDIDRRWREHRTELRSGRHKNKKLVRSWRKHGEEAHRFEIIELVAIDALADREGYWMRHFDSANTGFNLLAFADGRAAWNEDQRRERSRRATEIWASKPLTDEQRLKRSNSAKRRILQFPHTNPRTLAAGMTERKRAAIEKRRGIALSSDHRAKLSAAQKRRFKRDGTPPEVIAKRAASIKRTWQAKLAAGYKPSRRTEAQRKIMSEQRRLEWRTVRREGKTE